MTAKIKLNAASGGGSFSLQAPSSSANTRVMTLPDTADGTILTTTNPKTGNIIQVVNAIKTDTASTSSSFADTGLSASITPTSTSSKILIIAMLGGVGADNSSFKAKLMRGSTDVAVGDAASNRARATVQGQFSSSFNANSFHISALDSPSTTSATTYKVQFGGNGSVTVYLNRIARDSDGTAEDARTASTITLLEVAA